MTFLQCTRGVCNLKIVHSELCAIFVYYMKKNITRVNNKTQNKDVWRSVVGSAKNKNHVINEKTTYNIILLRF